MSFKTLLTGLAALALFASATAAHANFDGPKGAVSGTVVTPFRAGIYFIKPKAEKRQRVRIDLAKDGTYAIVGRPDFSFKLYQNTRNSYISVGCDKTLKKTPCVYSLATPYKRGLMIWETNYAATLVLNPGTRFGDLAPITALPYKSPAKNAAFFKSLHAMKDRSLFFEFITILPE